MTPSPQVLGRHCRRSVSESFLPDIAVTTVVNVFRPVTRWPVPVMGSGTTMDSGALQRLGVLFVVPEYLIFVPPGTDSRTVTPNPPPKALSNWLSRVSRLASSEPSELSRSGLGLFT
jgi:hypothetical protein